MSANKNYNTPQQRVRREGSERKLDPASIDRVSVLAGAVPGIGSSMIREFGLGGGHPTIAVTAEEQNSFRELISQLDDGFQQAISGEELTAPVATNDEAIFARQMEGMSQTPQQATSSDELAAQPGYADVAGNLDVRTQRLGSGVIRSAQQEATADLEVPNNGINPGYIRELENA
jgi:hypothetical protein